MSAKADERSRIGMPLLAHRFNTQRRCLNIELETSGRRRLHWHVLPPIGESFRACADRNYNTPSPRTILGKIECRDSAGELPQPGGDGGADLGTGVLLDEMYAGHRYLGLIGPGTTEIPDGTGQDAARLGVDEQLGQSRGRG